MAVTVQRAARYLLELDGHIGGSLKNVPSWKGNVLSFECGTRMSAAFFEWIDAFVQRKARPRQIVFYSTDFKGEVESAREYDNAYIKELTFPKLDAASKDTVSMALTLSARKWRNISKKAKLSPPADRSLVCSNFRMDIDSLPTDRVLWINRFTVSEGDYSNLVIGVSIQDFTPFQDWAQSSIYRGESRRKSGILEYLTPSLKDVVFRLSFGGLQVAQVSVGDQSTSTGSGSGQVKMAVSSVSFEALMSHYLLD